MYNSNRNVFSEAIHNKFMTIVRCAITVESDNPKMISDAAILLYDKLIDNNPSFTPMAIFASQTSDLTSFNCCTAIRTVRNVSCALECFQEAYIVGQLQRVIRFSVLYNEDFVPKHTYLKGAVQLRPDLSTSEEASN